jgi:uncharacterized protein (DUF1684 family)
MPAPTASRITLIAALVSIFVASHAIAIDLAQEQRVVEKWRAERVARLTGPAGWLTLVGLYWLHDGDNTFGRDKNNSLILIHKALPATLGTFRVQDDKVTFVARSGSTVTHAGKPITSVAMLSDAADEPTVLNAGSLEFFVIERAGKLGVRVRDVEHPARKGFHGIEYFPIGAEWVLDAKFEPYDPIRHIEIVNVLGMTEKMVSPGAIVFSKDGKDYRLDAILEVPDDQELFVMFADVTSARETYGAGRFLYIPMPSNGRTTIDFNKAYNPPCAFSNFATCPLPPWQNRLPLRIDAGEKKYLHP